MMTRVCATHEVVDCPMCSPTPDRAEPSTEAGRRFDHQWPGGTRIGRVQWREYICAIEAEARASAPEQGEPPCVYCNETRWVDDENWSPAYPETWKGERSPGDGLIPCGGCNEGGWNIPIARAASGAQAVPPLDVELILRLGHPAGCTVSGCHLKTAVDQYRAALHPEDGPQKHATWCWLPADHEGLCEGDQ